MTDKYIKIDNGVISCTHPVVEKLWQTGEWAITYNTNSFTTNVHIILKNGTRKDFIDLNENYDEVEKYISNL